MAEDISGAQAAAAIRIAFSRLRRRMRELGTDDDLSPSLVAVLTRLGKGEARSASALAELEGMRPQSMATILASLEQRGLIERGPDPDDGRRQIVELTSAGRGSAEGSLEARRHWLALRMEALSDADRRAVARAAEILDRVAAE